MSIERKAPTDQNSSIARELNEAAVEGSEPAPLELGVVARPHGVRGELKVQLHWPESHVLDELDSVLLSRKAGPLETFLIESVRRSNKGPLLKLAGIDTREDAEAARGARVHAKRAELPPLEADEYYLIDLLGFEVRSPTRSLGHVVEVRAHPTLDTLVIRDDEGRVCEQPVDDSWLDEVRLADQLVLLSSEDGLIE